MKPTTPSGAPLGALRGLSQREVLWLPRLWGEPESQALAWLDKAPSLPSEGFAQIARLLTSAHRPALRDALALYALPVQARAAPIHDQHVHNALFQLSLPSHAAQWLRWGVQAGERLTSPSLQRLCVAYFPVGPTYLRGAVPLGSLPQHVNELCLLEPVALWGAITGAGLWLLAASLLRADHRRTGSIAASLPSPQRVELSRIFRVLPDLPEPTPQALRVLARLLLLNMGPLHADSLFSVVARLGTCLVAVALHGRFDFEAQFLAFRLSPSLGSSFSVAAMISHKLTPSMLWAIQGLILDIAANPSRPQP